MTLTDNGSETKEGPLVDTEKNIKSKIYYINLQVTADSDSEEEIEDNSEEEAY